jgi:hypothetical protein
VTFVDLFRQARHGVKVAIGWALLSTTLAGTFAYHDHSILTPETDLSSENGDRYVTRHDPFSRACHLHAVIAVVHEQHCIACQFHRLLGSVRESHQLHPSPSVTAPTNRPQVPRLFVAFSPLGSRAPPLSS